MAASGESPLGSQEPEQLFFQHFARWNEQAEIDRFGGRAHALM
jgi:hypothetical protein